jgi:hypothetical protein
MRLMIFIFCLAVLNGKAQENVNSRSIISFGSFDEYISDSKLLDSINLYNEGYRAPKFPGGDTAMRKFIRATFRYPESSRYKGINDYCRVILTIDA